MKYYYNNEWNEMTAKVMDTLPIDTIVEYNGETVPTGWEEITDPDPVIYSGTEEPDASLGKIGDVYILLNTEEDEATTTSETEA